MIKIKLLLAAALSAIAATTVSTVSTIPSFARVFIIMMENEDYHAVIGNSAAPYINNLAHNFGLGTNYSGVTHPSLPNYMALTGGKTVFTSDCVGCTTSARHLVDQVVDSGRHWKAYMESMPTACSTTDTSLYVQKHNPFVHYDDVVKDPVRCRHHVVPYTQFATDLAANALPEFVWITPNMCHDMHSCSVSTGDTWLSRLVPRILASPAFNHSVLFLVWDEGKTANHIPVVVVSSWTKPGFKSSVAANHYGVLRTIEDSWHLSHLGGAASVSPMSGFFTP